MLFTACFNPISGQGRFGIGFSIEPVLCFTDMSPHPDLDEQTRAKFGDLFNYATGFNVEYQLENGLALASGLRFSRKRFGFSHEEGQNSDRISLWGHSEYHSLELPLTASITVVSNSDPFFEVAPILGISLGGDFSSYRNLTRQDENFSYSYEFDQENYTRNSFLFAAHTGVEFKTVIEQLGVMHWGLKFSRDLTKLPPFDYVVTRAGVPEEYTQVISMNYVSLSMIYYFNTWEVFNGKFLKRNFY